MLVGLGLRGFPERGPCGPRTGRSELLTDLDYVTFHEKHQVDFTTIPGDLGPLQLWGPPATRQAGAVKKGAWMGNRTESSLRAQL